MKKLAPVFGLTFLLPLLSCATTHMGAGHPGRILEHRKVAVTKIGIRVFEHRNWLTNDVETWAVPFSNDALERHCVDSIQRNLLQKGFAPVERRRVEMVLREQKRQTSGLYAEADNIGRLTGARALLTGDLVIQTENDLTYTIAETVIFPPMLLYRMAVPNTRTHLTFNGRLVSVEDGTILLSGEASITRRGFEMEDVSEVINEWFARVHEI